MMTQRKVAKGGPGAAADLVAYLIEELRQATAGPQPGQVADYYANETCQRLATYYAGDNSGPVRVGAGVTDEVRHHLGLDQDGPPDAASLERIIGGRLADGSEFLAENATVAGFDFTFSADRSVSVAYALATDPHERAAIVRAHREAVGDTMREVIALEMGYTRRGKDGVVTVAGDIAWIEFDHTASRPVPARALYADDPDRPGISPDDLLPGDPNLHTHTYVPNYVRTVDEDGNVHIGAIDSERLRGRTHEFRAFYQAKLAANLARLGVEIHWDGAGAVRVSAIPEEIREMFSKRARAGDIAVRKWANEQGLNFDAMSPDEQHRAIRTVLGLDRHLKEGLDAKFESWQEQAAATGYRHKAIIPSDDDLAAKKDATQPSPAERLEEAVKRADVLAADLFSKESVLTLQQLRVCCAQASIGLFDEFDDVSRVQAALLDQGVTMDGARTQIVVGHLPLIDDTRPNRDGVQKPAAKKRTRGRNGQSMRGDEILVTTEKHVQSETAVVRLTKDAAADTSESLAPEEIAAAVRRSETREKNPLRFNTEHGQAQLQAVYRLGQAGKVALLIGVAGAGKSALAAPLVDAWKCRGMEVHGIAVAWRQANDLEGAGIRNGEGSLAQTKRSRGGRRGRDNGDDATQEMRDAGVAEDRLHAVAAFIRRFEQGQITVDKNTVVLLDEVGQLGVRDARRLLEIQRQTGCHLKMIGDPLQCVSVEAGPTIDLMIRALGEENVPTLLSTVRQEADSEKINAALWRSGQAAKVIENKRADNEIGDGTARLVRGDAETYAEAVATRWAEMAAEASANNLSLGVSAPTNAHARLIGNAIRERRRQAGEIIGEDRVIACTDSRGADQFDLALAVGDRVRLFRKTRGKIVGGRGGAQVGVNGSIVEVRGFTPAGIILRGAAGVDTEVKWATLTHKQTGRIQLNRGEAFTPDGAQGATRHLWLDAMATSAAMTSGKAYVTGSRHVIRHEMMVSEDAEREAILRERALGDQTPITVDEVWERVAANLSRGGAKTSAMLLAETARGLRRAAADVLLRHQVDRAARLGRGQRPDQAAAERRVEQTAITAVVPAIERAVSQAREALAAVQAVTADLAVRTVQPGAGSGREGGPQRPLGAPVAATGGDAQPNLPGAAQRALQAIVDAIREAAPQITAAIKRIRRSRGWEGPTPEAEIEGPRLR